MSYRSLSFVAIWVSVHANNYAHYSLCFVFGCDPETVDFTHIRRGYVTDTGTIISTKQNTIYNIQPNHAYISWKLLYFTIKPGVMLRYFICRNLSAVMKPIEQTPFRWQHGIYNILSHGAGVDSIDRKIFTTLERLCIWWMITRPSTSLVHNLKMIKFWVIQRS